MHHGGKGVILVHRHANHIHSNAASQDVGRVGIHQIRIAGFSVGHHKQPEGAIPKTAVARFQKSIGPDLDVFSQWGAPAWIDRSDGRQKPIIVARSQRVGPVVLQVGGTENQQAHVSGLWDVAEHVDQGLLGGVHFGLHLASRHGLFHRT